MRTDKKIDNDELRLKRVTRSLDKLSKHSGRSAGHAWYYPKGLSADVVINGVNKKFALACPTCLNAELRWDNWYMAKERDEDLRTRCANGHVHADGDALLYKEIVITPEEEKKFFGF
jgi:hypothetical protein